MKQQFNDSHPAMVVEYPESQEEIETGIEKMLELEKKTRSLEKQETNNNEVKNDNTEH